MRSFGRTCAEMWRSVKFELPSTLGSILTIILATIIPGIFWIAHKNMSQAQTTLKNSMTMDVFLRNELTVEQITRIQKEMLSLSGVVSAAYISKDEAFSRMEKRFGAEMLAGMEDDNPLPASFVLNVDQSIFTPAAAESLAKRIKTIPEVDDVVFAIDTLTRLGKLMRTIEIVGLALSILVAFAAIFIVANTVRVAIAERRKTVEIMQLIGATRGYILTPFVLLGGLLGLLGTGLSLAALYYLANYVTSHFVSVIFLAPYEITVFVLIGLLLGMIGALGATQRYLKI